MSLIKYSPISSLLDPAGSFDSMMDQFFGRNMRETMSGFLNPATDIKETAEGYTISAEMPGVKKEDVKVELNDGVITISAEKKEESEKSEDGKVVWRERRQGQYVRRFNLGGNVSGDKIKANFDNGVLTIKLPKTNKEVAAAKSIPIN